MLTLSLLSCTAAFEPAESKRYEPLPAYQHWYEVMEHCAGKSKSHWGLQSWYLVEGEDFYCPAYDGKCIGWWSPRHRITIAGKYVADSLNVSHEMLHDILQSGHNLVTDLTFDRCGV